MRFRANWRLKSMLSLRHAPVQCVLTRFFNNVCEQGRGAWITVWWRRDLQGSPTRTLFG